MASASQTRLDLYRCLATLDALGPLLPGAHVTMAIESIELGLAGGDDAAAAENRAWELVCVHDSQQQ